MYSEYNLNQLIDFINMSQQLYTYRQYIWITVVYYRQAL